MTPLQHHALGTVPLSEATVESFYEGSRSGTAEQCLKAMCKSHERLRAELQGAEILLNETPGKSVVRSLLTACKEALAWLRRLNDFEKVCQALIAVKVGPDDMAIVLSNVMRHLDNATEAVERSLSPKKIGQSDFEAFLEETFCGRDVDLKMETVPHPQILTYDQAIQLATWIYGCMENTKPPWYSKFEGMEKRLDKALALTDTGSREFLDAFPPKSAGDVVTPREVVPGWRVVDRIRQALLP